MSGSAVAFVGIGNMGFGMAARLLDQGWPVHVCDLDAQRCADVAALRPGHTVMWCPTVAPDTVEGLAARLATQGVHSMDAPMSGGPVRARDGSMSLLVACPEAVFATHATVLSALSNQVFCLGQRVGDGVPHGLRARSG